MKKLLMLLCGVLAVPLMATVTVNTTVTTPYTNAKTDTIDGATMSEGSTIIITANLKFTLPTAMPAYATFKNDKLAIVADPDGKLLIADGAKQALVDSGVTTTENAVVSLRAVGTLMNGVLTFAVSLNNAAATTVTAPSSGTKLATLVLDGEGETDELLLSMAPTGVVPAGSGGTQDVAMVEKYVTWVNGIGKGVSADIAADAFAMNAGGAPSLEITSIDPEKREIKVKGWYAKGTGQTEVKLGTIYGKLYVTYSETLGGAVKILKEDIAIDSTGVATVTLPEDAKFARARVEMAVPDTAESL